MAVGTKYHSAASGHHLPHVLMNDRNMWRNIDAPVFLRRGQTEHVVILIDGPAYRAKGIVAICQYIRNRELFHAGSLGCLYNTHEGDVMGCHAVKPQLEMFHVTGCIVGLQNGVGNGPFPGRCLVRVLAGQFLYLSAL